MRILSVHFLLRIHLFLLSHFLNTFIQSHFLSLSLPPAHNLSPSFNVYTLKPAFIPSVLPSSQPSEISSLFLSLCLSLPIIPSPSSLLYQLHSLSLSVFPLPSSHGVRDVNHSHKHACCTGPSESTTVSALRAS